MQRTQAGLRERDSWIVLKRLPDGALILIRPIRADDKRFLEDGLRQLSPESVHRRFLSPKRNFSRAELRYLTEVDGRDHVALVAEYIGAPVRRVIAVGRFVRWADHPDAAEVAITVCDDWQRRGVGSLFAELLAAEARRGGISRFTATMSSNNVPAHKLLERLTWHLDEQHQGGGVSEVVAELAA
jgi:GNAT superfamily N-acetyltransferase